MRAPSKCPHLFERLPDCGNSVAEWGISRGLSDLLLFPAGEDNGDDRDVDDDRQKDKTHAHAAAVRFHIQNTREFR